MSTMQITVTAFVNVAVDDDGRPPGFSGYHPKHELAQVDEPWVLKAINDTHAAEVMFAIGNRERDLEGRDWPRDVRSLSVGDVLKIATPPCHAYPEGNISWLACARIGWDVIDQPREHRIVALAGTGATSRAA